MNLKKIAIITINKSLNNLKIINNKFKICKNKLKHCKFNIIMNKKIVIKSKFWKISKKQMNLFQKMIKQKIINKKKVNCIQYYIYFIFFLHNII